MYNYFTTSRCALCLSLSLLLVWDINSYALPSDQQAPIELFANKADLNKSTGQSVFTGDVKLDQGSSHLRAERAIVLTDKNNRLVRATAFAGKRPAHFWTLPKEHEPLMHAYAKKIVYLPKQNEIILTGDAHIQQGEDHYRAPKIRYNTKEKHVISSSNKKHRTVIVIHPSERNYKLLS